MTGELRGGPARAILAGPLVALSLGLLIYVAYAHFAASRARRTQGAATFAVDLGSPGAVTQGFAVEAEGGARYAFDDGHLVVSGSSSPGEALASVRFTGTPVRLTDSRLRVRFRRRDASSGGVFVSFLGPASGAGVPHELRLTIHAAGRAVISGDGADAGPRQQLVCSSEDLTSILSAGPSDAWHELVLRASPGLGTALGSVDGVPVVSCPLGWATGAPVRAAFGAEAEGAPLGIEFAMFADDLVSSDDRAESFVDRFDGNVLDPLRWALLVPDPWLVRAQTKLLPSGGLWIDATSTRAPDLVAGQAIVTRRAALGSFRLAARIRVRALHAASVFLMVGTRDSALVARRSFEAGLFDAGGGEIAPFAAGHWAGSGQHSFEPIARTDRQPPSTDSAWQVELAFDARSGLGHVAIGGATVFEHTMDLRPLESVIYEVGTNLHELGAHAEIVLEELRFDAL